MNFSAFELNELIARAKHFHSECTDRRCNTEGMPTTCQYARALIQLYEKFKTQVDKIADLERQSDHNHEST